jgi:hypothetical protein
MEMLCHNSVNIKRRGFGEHQVKKPKILNEEEIDEFHEAIQIVN